MQENYNLENDEIIIDFNKIGKIIWNRKFWIISCFILIISYVYITTNLKPKKYQTDAQIYINKAENTNLVDINPFAIADSGGSSGGGLAGILGAAGGGGLGNELEIMKSPLVMNRVIRENNLKYKGKYINAVGFASSKDLTIDNVKGSKSITIAYKSADPKQAYNIVNSIIACYKETYENINSKKAYNDKRFLTNSYNQAKADLDKKITDLKRFKNQSTAYTNTETSFGLIGMYDKRLEKDINRISTSSMDLKKLESELDQESEKVKMLKTKLEWINLVGAMSKNTTNISILKEPEIKALDEFSEPNMNSNLMLAIVVSFITSLFIIIGLEVTSKKQTFSDMDEKTIIVKNNIDLSNLKTKVLINNINDLAVISLAKSDKTQKYFEIIKRELANNISINFTNENSSLDEHIKNIMSSENVVLIGQLGNTEKKPFNQIKDVCKELKKNVINTFLIV